MVLQPGPAPPRWIARTCKCVTPAGEAAVMYPYNRKLAFIKQENKLLFQDMHNFQKTSKSYQFEYTFVPIY